MILYSCYCNVEVYLYIEPCFYFIFARNIAITAHMALKINVFEILPTKKKI